jgi:hypothetical protein
MCSQSGVFSAVKQKDHPLKQNAESTYKQHHQTIDAGKINHPRYGRAYSERRNASASPGTDGTKRKAQSLVDLEVGKPMNPRRSKLNCCICSQNLLSLGIAHR